MLYGSDVAIQPATSEQQRRHQGEQPDLRLERRRSACGRSARGGRAAATTRPPAASRSPARPPSATRRRPGRARNAASATRRAHRRQQLRERPGRPAALAGRDHLEPRGAHSRPASITRARNSRVRGSVGLLKICSGGPSSQITPTSRKQTLSATSLRERHLVRGDDHRHPAVGQLAHEVQHLGDELRVERARDLVEQHQLRIHRERADDRHPLLLTARKPVGELVGLVREADPAQQLERTQARLLLRPCPRALRGASVTFSSTVMCGNRL